MRKVHKVCFPGEAPDEISSTTASTSKHDDDDDEVRQGPETEPEFWDRITACHDEDDVTWFLLFDGGDDGGDGDDQGEDEEEGESSSSTKGTLLGFAATVFYAKSLYGMHLAVVPSQRGRGFGAWLMREAQAWALHNGHTQIQASVEAAHVRLLRYYKGLGARVVTTGVGSGNSAAPTVVRIARDFDRVVAEREVEASRRRAEREVELFGRGDDGEKSRRRRRRSGVRRWMRRLVLSVTKSVTAAAAVAAAVVVSVRLTNRSARRAV